MNTAVILTLIFGGILFFILDVMFFDMKDNNIKWIIMTIGAFIPLLGLGIYGILFFYCMGNYETDATGYSHKDHHHKIYVRDTKLNRWLFNDIDWKLVDSMKNYKDEKR